MYPAFAVVQILICIRAIGQMREEPGVEPMAWLALNAALAILWIFAGIRQFRSAHIVEVDGDGMGFWQVVGNRTCPTETVTTVTGDQIQFHLYSSKKEISLSKKKIPPELAQILQDRIEEESAETG